MNSCSCGDNLENVVKAEKGIFFQISNLCNEVSCLESNVKILEDRLTSFKVPIVKVKSPSDIKEDVKVKEPESDISRRLLDIRLKIRNINDILQDNFKAFDF